MASSSPLPPPPGADSPSGAAPTAPPSASPSAPVASPMMQQGTQMVLSVVQGLRAIAKAFPETSPAISDINNKMREVQSLMMKSGNPGESAAPPMGSD